MKFEVDWSAEDPGSEFEQNWESEMVRRITAAPFPETVTKGTSHIQGKTAFDQR